jgi:hypothetical protein
LVAFELPELLTEAQGQAGAPGPEQVVSVPLRLHYLGTVQPPDARVAPVHYHVYQTTTATTNQEHGALYFLAAGPAAVAPTPLGAALHPEVPGQLTLQVQPFEAADTRFQRRLPDGRVLQHGASLGTLRTLFDGDRGVIVDPALGQAHVIDLTSWTAADPEQTYLNIAFYFRPAE